MVAENGRTNGFSAFVEDRPGQGMFRIDRAIYTEDAVFEAELERIFEHSWLYLCHESQIAEHGDYYASHIGRQPVFAIRQKDGAIGAFLNACAHRGAILTRRRRANATTLACRFHGWCYDTEGRCIRIKNEKSGFPDGDAKARYGLTPVPRVDSYKGFVFASLDADVPPLIEHLGQAAPFIDLMAEQSPDGMEVVAGQQTYLIRGNWKLQAENGVDGYHVATVHRVFAAAIAKREKLSGAAGTTATDAGRIAGLGRNGCYDLGGGHKLVWSERGKPELAPLHASLAKLETMHPEAKIDWMLRRGRNLMVFPNLLLLDQASTHIRVFRPIAKDRTEVRVYCIAPVGEAREARAARLRKFEDFFMVTGMATPDDLAALEDCQSGAMASGARWTDMERGIGQACEGADELAAGIGARPAASAESWDHEILYHGFFRRWVELMDADAP